MPAPRIDPKRAKKYITATQLRERWGGVSHMFIERLLKTDPKMPRWVKFAERIRFFDIDEIEAYERSKVVAPAVARRRDVRKSFEPGAVMPKARRENDPAVRRIGAHATPRQVRSQLRLRHSHIFARAEHDHYVEPGWCSQRLFAVESFGSPRALRLCRTTSSRWSVTRRSRAICCGGSASARLRPQACGRPRTQQAPVLAR